MFRIPEKQIIINQVSQMRVLNLAGSGTYTDITTPATTDGFYLEGFLQPVLFSKLKLYATNLRIKAEVAVAPVAQTATFVCNAVTGAAAGEPFRIVYDSLDKTPTEYQNVPIEKHYQVSVNLAVNATAIATATAIVAAINADKNSPVTASNGGTATVTLVAKNTNMSFVLYTKPVSQGGLITGTFTVTVAPTKGINNYDNLKNINWAKNLDFDRNVEFFPEYGATYKSYKFIIQSTGFMASPDVAGGVPPTSETEIQLWIKTGLALITTMDLVVADANGALA